MPQYKRRRSTREISKNGNGETIFEKQNEAFPISNGMKSIGEILPDIEKKAAEAPKGRKRQTERGELMRFFLRHLNYSRKNDGLAPMTMAHLGTVLEKIPTQDLYYLKSVCSQAQNFGKKFWWELDPKKH
ncbi:MAG: hypothetical protein NTU85_02645 [Candidatus Kaiserbacteria bacterium]|nr:hypothetical protein [Candidatus Kaiserbacteria bacterium]